MDNYQIINRQKEIVPPHPGVPKDMRNQNYLIMYTAKWCRPCKLSQPMLDELKKEGYLVYKVDTGRYRSEARAHKILFLPTFIIMDKGKEVTRQVGRTKKEVLIKDLKKKRPPKPHKPRLY